MLFIDVAILVAVAAVCVGVATLVGGRLGGRLEERRRRELGAKNAAEERRRLEERCAACDEPIDPRVDLWERGQWWHRSCWRESVGE